MKQKRFGVIDILIVLSLLVVLGLGVSFTRKPEVIEEAETKFIRYSFEVTNVGDEFIDNMDVGDALYQSSKDTYLGELVDYEVNPSQIFHRDTRAGQIVIIESPIRIDVKMIVEAEVEVKNGILQVSDEDIMVGRGLPVKGKGYASYGFIVEIEE